MSFKIIVESNDAIDKNSNFAQGQIDSNTGASQKAIEIEVKEDEVSSGHHGLKGSLLDLLLGHGIHIEHACGGVSACSTCHLYVTQGLESCNPAQEEEEDQLDQAPLVRANSRLSCQCVPNGSKDVKVMIPSWNRNLVSEKV